MNSIYYRQLFSPEEMKKIKEAIEHKNGVTKYVFPRSDKENDIGITLWNNAGNDVTGVAARLQKTAGIMEEVK